MSEKPLNLSQLRFIAEYVKDGNAKRAAIAAGYAEKSAKSIGYSLLQVPAVQDAVEATRKEVQVQAVYNLAESMREAEEAMKFAKETENANAYVKAVELRSKLNGLLIERVDLRAQSGFHVNIIRRARALPDIPLVKSEEDDDDIWS